MSYSNIKQRRSLSVFPGKKPPRDPTDGAQLPSLTSTARVLDPAVRYGRRTSWEERHTAGTDWYFTYTMSTRATESSCGWDRLSGANI